MEGGNGEKEEGSPAVAIGADKKDLIWVDSEIGHREDTGSPLPTDLKVVAIGSDDTG